MSSVHGGQTADGPSDCPHEGCWYEGELGFKRKDDLAPHRLVHGDRPQGALPVFVIADSVTMAAGVDQLLLHPPQKPLGLMNQRPVMREEESESPPLFGKPQKSFCSTSLQGRPKGSPIGRPSHGGTGLPPVLGAAHWEKKESSIWEHEHTNQQECFPASAGFPTLTIGNG